VADVVLEDADTILRAVAHTADLTADLVTWARNLAATLTTDRGLAMLRILMAASLENEHTADRLRAGDIEAQTAQAAADAIVGGIVYSILREGRAYSRQRAELTTRTVVRALDELKSASHDRQSRPAVGEVWIRTQFRRRSRPDLICLKWLRRLPYCG
jgi:hypothetical protein